MLPVILFFLFTASVKADLIEECMNYTVYPLQYELTITPYIFNDVSYYNCNISIDVIANAPDIRVIELDAKDLEIREGSIKVLYGNSDIVNGARPYEYNEKMGKLYIHLREPLKRYDSSRKYDEFIYKIQISFIKYVGVDSTGVFLVKHYDEDRDESKYFYTTRFSPNKAKYAFPCFDNPRFEAGFKFQVNVIPERKFLQYTNTSLAISEILKKETTKDYQIIKYMPSPQVALHQVGFHFSQFDSIQDNAKLTNDTIIVWAPSEELNNYNFTLKYGVNLIDMIHEYSGTKRPLMNGPINLVAVSKDLDGFEVASWNLLTYSASKLANIEQYTSVKQLERMKFDLAQHLSRLWLGNPGEAQVTRWKEEWFKEGMATYLAYYLLAQYNHGDQSSIRRPLGSYGMELKLKAMDSDWHHSTPALTNFNNTLAVEIPSRYKQLVTMKTAAIWWMLENWFQENQLHQALVKHINGMRGHYISLWDLIHAIDKDTIECTYQFFNGSTPSRILKSWFGQVGYPVVTVNVLRDRTPNAIQLKQRHFSFTPHNREPSDYLIPITYVVQTNDNCFNCQQPKFTIGAQTYTFGENLNNGWIILNRNASGYYRVNYDEYTWKLIADSLKKDHTAIDEMNRAQIVNDIFALYTAGDISRELSEEVLDYLDREKSPVVWDAAINGFQMLRIDGAYTQMTKFLFWEWEEFMAKKLENIFDTMHNHDTDGDLETRLLRSNIMNFASEINYEPCLNYLKNVHRHSRFESIDPDIREAVLYFYENGTNMNLNYYELNQIEMVDKEAAQHRVQERNRFLMRCPYGEPRPLPIISTELPTDTAVTGEQHLKSSASLLTAFSYLLIIPSLYLLL